MHMCSTMGLGGFSSHDASFGYWNSPLIDYTVAVVFMTLAGIQLLAALRCVAAAVAACRTGTIRKPRPTRSRWSSPACAVSASSCTHSDVYRDRGEALRYATFNVVSIATTTGYASTDYNQWPIFAPVLMLFLCGFTTCAGSTGGGIKMIRGADPAEAGAPRVHAHPASARGESGHRRRTRSSRTR